jgi:hypothetical protein
MEAAQIIREKTKSKRASGGVQKTSAPVGGDSCRSFSLNDKRSAHCLGTSACLPRTVQAKLTIGQTGDQYEQEADRVAEQVMRLPDTSLRVQRKCGCGAACETCESLKLQRQSAAAGMPYGATAPLTVHEVLRSTGAALDENTRSFFEGRFRQDFGGVRIHTDESAAASARQINARAYTVGHDIVFAPGQYAPGTATGTHLLAHELTHVIQQAPGIHRQPETIPVGPLQTNSAAALRYQPTMRPHVPTAPTISPPPPVQQGPTPPTTCPPTATVLNEIRTSDIGSRTETKMQHDINLARSLSSLSLPASDRTIRQADQAIRAVFGSLLPAGRNFAAPASVTTRTPQEFADLRIPNETAARRRIGEVALEVASQQLADLCINDAADPVLQREVVSPLFGRVGANFVKEYERGRIGGQTTFPVVSGHVRPHVDIPSQSRNIGHIIVHEAMHFYVSEVYQNTAEAGSLTRQLMEGGAEFLARSVINQRLASDPNFRIHTETYADEFSYVATFLMGGGVSSFSLAYFQGRVDLLGLAPPVVHPKLMVGQQNEPCEMEADRMADWVMSERSGPGRSRSASVPGPGPQMEMSVSRGQAATAGDVRQPPLAVSQVSERRVARFSDTGHHVIEEAALTGAGFSPQQIQAIERGNIQRDYSQIGRVGNFLLLCRPQRFGGYEPEEHFDNFIFDAVTNRWRSRGVGRQFRHADPNVTDRTPFDYIESQLMMLARTGMTEDSLVHLGNAFHTVEDFFAHSNFVELINHEVQGDQTLLTGSVPGTEGASVAHVVADVSGPPMREYYQQQAAAATARTDTDSHARMAHDTPDSHNYAQARRLAALVVQNLGVDVRAALQQPQAAERGRLMSDTVMTKIRRFLRPPSQDDRWWEQLVEQDAGVMDRRLEEVAGRTPVTVNQCVFNPLNPLRNLEASSSSSWRMPIGVALPVQVGSTHIWLQVGGGVQTPFPLDRSVREPPAREDDRGGFIAGGQITGRF